MKNLFYYSLHLRGILSLSLTLFLRFFLWISVIRLSTYILEEIFVRVSRNTFLSRFKNSPLFWKYVGRNHFPKLRKSRLPQITSSNLCNIKRILIFKNKICRLQPELKTLFVYSFVRIRHITEQCLPLCFFSWNLRILRSYFVNYRGRYARIELF